MSKNPNYSQLSAYLKETLKNINTCFNKTELIGKITDHYGNPVIFLDLNLLTTRHQKIKQLLSKLQNNVQTIEINDCIYETYFYIHPKNKKQIIIGLNCVENKKLRYLSITYPLKHYLEQDFNFGANHPDNIIKKELKQFGAKSAGSGCCDNGRDVSFLIPTQNLRLAKNHLLNLNSATFFCDGKSLKINDFPVDSEN